MIIITSKNAEIKGMKKRIRCKADVEDEYRSNLMVVRISSKHPTQQIAFYSPRPIRPVHNQQPVATTDTTP